VLIDWFTVIAQIINFLILVALLKYFLYGRIIQAMDQREEKIAARLAEAEQRQREAEEERQHYKTEMDDLEQQKEDILSEAREKADSERKKLMGEAREEVETARSRWYEAIDREKTTFLEDLRQRAGRQIYNITRRALADLATADLEQQIIEAFCRRLQDLPPEKRRELVDSLQSGTEVTITSAFTLPEEARKKIDIILRANLRDSLDIHYQTSAEIISGIELKVPGHKIAWSLEQYLADLEAATRNMLEEKIPI
jgi:F-type H+-transporting ATPase subunit b